MSMTDKMRLLKQLENCTAYAERCAAAMRDSDPECWQHCKTAESMCRRFITMLPSDELLEQARLKNPRPNTEAAFDWMLFFRTANEVADALEACADCCANKTEHTQCQLCAQFCREAAVACRNFANQNQ